MTAAMEDVEKEVREEGELLKDVCRRPRNGGTDGV